MMFDLFDFDDCAIMRIPKVRKIMFNDPATIVFWTDGTKTVVKATGSDRYVPYYGFLAALAKKVYGSNTKVQEMIAPWLPEAKEEKKAEVPVTPKSEYCSMQNGCMFCDHLFCDDDYKAKMVEARNKPEEKKCEQCGKCKKEEEVQAKADDDGDDTLEDLLASIFALAALESLREKFNEKISKYPED